MLTLFAVPKAFCGDDAELQRNALKSWKRLGDVQILLISDDDGVKEAAAAFEVEHVGGVEVNEFGTPMLDSAFALAEESAQFPLIAYANADLLFPASLMDAVRAAVARQRRFMLVGQCEEDGRLRGFDWIDYFVYPKGALGRLPPFAVGRPWWDTWMIWRARKIGLDLIDVTADVRVIHQAHGYGHVQASSGYRWFGPEGDANRSHVRLGQSLSIEDATHRLERGEVVKIRQSPRRRVKTVLFMHGWAIPLYRLVRALYRPVKWIRRRTASSDGA